MARGLLLLLFVGAVGNASGSSLSCRERGFADALQCSGCKKMHDLVKDDELFQECEHCCTDDAQAAEIKVFSEAKLEICK